MPIAARFHAVRDRVLAATDKAFAEPVRLLFMSGNGPDPNRAAIEIDCVVRVGGEDVANPTGGFAQTWASRIAAGKAEAHINSATYAGPMPRKGDKIVALSRPGEPAWSVSHVNDRDQSRLILALSQI